MRVTTALAALLVAGLPALDSAPVMARSEPGHVYGAIAYSKSTGAFGFSYEFPNSEEANELALSKCSQNAQDCYVVISFSNLCASVVADSRREVYWGHAASRGEAQRQAMSACRNDGGVDCDVKVWACSM